MAVVTGRSDLIHDPFDITSVAADPERARGRLRKVTGTVSNASTDNAGSKYKLCALPSYAILDHNTNFKVSGWGFATVQIGTRTAATALLNVARSAATNQLPNTMGDANHGKPLWQQLGLAADPGGDIELWATGPADATTAGSMPFSIYYTDR